MAVSTALVWFRQDLRLKDHPALSHALANHDVVIPVYIWSPEEAGQWQPGAASKWWLHHSLEQLQQALANCDSRLILRQGERSAEVLEALCQSTGATAVYWNSCYESWALSRDAVVTDQLQALDVRCHNLHAGLLLEPASLMNQQGAPYQVFTPFWKAAQQLSLPKVVPAPGRIPQPKVWPESEPLSKLKLLPKVDWTGGLQESWEPGIAGAEVTLDEFIGATISDYQKMRDFPAEEGTSRLSPYLHFGELSPGMILEELENQGASIGTSGQAFIRQLYWREFAHYLLYHFPETVTEPLRPAFKAFPWKSDPEALKAWKRGETGYPIVDAGMRQLWHTGWMHNRVRMIVASFLVKQLLIPWQEGAAWFWDTLVDADLANNTLGWQWAAGCGADAAPYFRIFNPMTQGAKFDAEGAYVQQWVPELAGLPKKHLHEPWKLSEIELQAAGVSLGKNYPNPIVDHYQAREMALAAYGTIKKGKQL